MKEKDLDKNLDTIIIDGVIKEAEQENADFAAAIRKMSKEEFEEMVYQPVYADMEEHFGATESSYRQSASIAAEPLMDYDHQSRAGNRKSSKFKIVMPWLMAAVSSAAVILLVLIPSLNSMNGSLGDSALYMSENYITLSKGGFDVSSASIEEIKKESPSLQERYDSSIIKEGHETLYTTDFQDAGCTLAVAYLKLHKKGEAIKVLKTLESQSKGTVLGEYCKKLLQQLD